MNFMIVHTILKHINASSTVKLTPRVMHVDVNKGMVQDVLTDTVDMTINSRFLRNYWKLQTYPVYLYSLNIMSLKYSTTFMEQLMSLFAVEVWLDLTTSCVVGVIMLRIS